MSVFDLKVSPYLSLVCQFCQNSFMLYPNKQVNHANGLARVGGQEVFDVTWLLKRRVGRVEALSLGGEAQSTFWSGHTLGHKHLEQAPGPCLHLHLVMKKQMPRCNQKLTERVGPRSDFCGRFCDQNTPWMEIPYCVQEELMTPHSCIWIFLLRINNQKWHHFVNYNPRTGKIVFQLYGTRERCFKDLLLTKVSFFSPPLTRKSLVLRQQDTLLLK